MAYIKSAPRSALAAFAPDAPYLAAGTMSGAVDLSFSSSANLEIFKLDFQSDSQELPVVGSCPSSDRFNRLSWGKPKSGSTEYSLGLIAGGLGDGTISVWNPAKLISSEGSEDSFVVRLEKHTGPVRGLEFNPHEPKLLASGADEGELCIWDLENPLEPILFPSLKNVGSGSETEISFVSWNVKFQHILASTSYNGITVVWDLRQQKPLASFLDPSKRRCSVLQWNPEVSTQLIVASDDDSSPALRVWDARKTISPVREFVGHTKGVIAMSWCPYESSLLLTCAKDNRTICWDTNTGEIHCELPASTNWNFDIHWHPKIPGVISASSFDVKLGIYNIEACNKLVSDGNPVSPVCLRAPKWLNRLAGASFGFGGKLATFHPGQAAPGASSFASEVHLHNLVTEDSLVNRSAEFEAAIQSGERNSLQALCEKKSLDSLSDDEKEVWAFLKVMFEEDGTARRKLLTHLGFRVPNAESEVTTDELGKEFETHSFEDNMKKGTTFKGGDTPLPIDNEDEFFNNPGPSEEVLIVEEEICDEKQDPRVIEPTSDSDSSIDETIQSALVVGDYKEAVRLCMSAKRVADALVIAHIGGPSLWEVTRDKYLQSSLTSYLKIVAAMATNDLMTLVSTRPLNSWKETLALLCTFAQKEEWIVLCDTLGSRLLTVGNTLAATLCYICAGNIHKIVEIWSRSLMHEQDGRSYVDLLQDIMEKIIVLSLASGQKQLSKSLSKLVENYAELLASQGLLSTAMEYLKLLGSEDSSVELTILQDRIAVCTEERGITNLPFEESPQQHDHVHNIDGSTSSAVNGSQHYYQDNTKVQPQQPTSSGQYGDGYQQNLGSYGGYLPQVPQQGQQFLGYTNSVQYQSTQSSFQPTQSSFQPTQSSFQPTQSSFQPTQSSFQPIPSSFQPTPSSFQPTQSPHVFIPSQSHQVPQQNYGQPPAPAQPVVRPFIPTNPPALRNADQYQQPHTLGSQFYPGVPSQNYQTGAVLATGPPQPGSVHSHRFPQPGTAPSPRSFMPVTSSSFGHTAGFNAIQPLSPTQKVQQPIVVSPAPLPTVQTVDTSKVSAELRPVIGTLTRLYQETSEALGGQRANPAKKREIDDNSRKIGALFAKLNSGDISLNASSKLCQLCQALDTGDFASALHIQVLLTTSDWDECNFWLAALKRMIKTRQNVLM